MSGAENHPPLGIALHASYVGAAPRSASADARVSMVPAGNAPDRAGSSTLIVWHDGACPLCRREVALMRRLDRRGAIDFIDANAAGPAACPIDRAALLSRFHARENGVLLSGAAAFAAMWRAIPLLRPLGIAARARWILALLERVYLLFLRVRPLLQRIAGGASPR